MKQIYPLILIVFANCLQAQIQITQAHMPSIGDTIRYSSSGTINKDFIQTGSNYSWNYADLNTTAQDIYRFQALINTPSTLAFTGMPIGAIGYKVADSIGQGQAALKNIYNFYQKNSTGWSAVGTGFTLPALPLPAGGVYKDKDEIYSFPLRFNDKDSTTFDVITQIGNIIVQLGTFRQYGYRINTVEGWGTITTPYGTAINCLKIKSRVVETDSLKITTPAINVGFQSNRVEYRWLSTSEKIPVLEVIGTEIGGNFTPNSIRFRDNYRVPGPSPLAPRPKFDCNKYQGIQRKDTFQFINQTVLTFGTTYLWSFNPSKGIRYFNSDSTSKNPKIVFDSVGIYDVTLKTSNLIGSNDSTATAMLQINKDNSQSLTVSKNVGITVFPNPSSQILYFTNSQFIGKICRIFDASGKLLIEKSINDSLSVGTETLSAGLYTVLISDHEFCYYTQINIE